jgi:filamentous hemagglutinin family protein
MELPPPRLMGIRLIPFGAGTVNGNNLFHSFDQFNVPASGVIFGTDGSSVDGNSIQNILNRVTGGDPSSIFGAIESSGAFPNANLYLLNPNGIIFGAGASLDIGGSFHASTATSLLFDSNQIFSVDC